MDNIRITIETNANDAAKTFENLSNAFNDADNGARDLRKDIKDLKSEIYKMTPGTEEYANALVELGDKMNTLGDIQRDLKASSGGLDTVFQTTTTAIGTMASGFQAAMGVVTLFGGETEDLQKTFIQLQSVMSIAQGLKGFSGFAKYTQTASASLKAFTTKLSLSIKAVKADTKEKVKDTAATRALDKAQQGAALSTNLLRTGFSKLTAAMAANPIGAIIVALTAFVAIATKVTRSNKEIAEAQEKANKALGEASDNMRTVNDIYEEYNRETERTVTKLKAVGATTEDINSYTEKRLELLEKEIEYEMRRIKYVNETTSYIMREVNAQKLGYASYKKMNEALEEYSDMLEEVKQKLQDMADAKNPLAEYNAQMKKELEAMDVLIAEGLASTKDKYLKQIELAEEGKNQILAKYRGSRGGAYAKISEVDKQALATYDSQIENLTQQIKIIDAGHRKEVRESTRKTMETYEKNFTGLGEKIADTLEGFVDETKKTLNKFYSLDIEGSSMGGGIMAKMRSILLGMDKDDSDFNDAIKELQDDITDALENGEIELDDWVILFNRIQDMKKQYEAQVNNFLNELFKDEKFELPSGNKLNIENFTDMLKPFGTSVDKAVEAVAGFRERIQNLDEAFSNGEITPDEYMEALIRNVTEWKLAVEQNLEKIPEIVNSHISEIPGFSDMNAEEQQAIVDMITSYLKRSMYIPDSEIDGIVADAKEIMEEQLDKVFAQIKDEYDGTLVSIQTKYAAMLNDKYTSGGTGIQGFLNGLLGGEFWGIGEGQSYQMAKQQTEETFAAYKEATDKDIAEIDRLMAAAGDDMALREDLNKRKLKLQADYNLEMEKYYNELEELEHGHLKGIVDNMNSVLSATGSLGSALSDYYSEMANDERLSEKEQKKYTLKSLKMKKAMAFVSIAQGIVSAIAGAMDLGFPMGPIVAAIESASVAAAGAVQISQINKQIRELNGSAGGSDTPDAAGMVDRIISANTQNTDQTAQLNAQYTGGAMGEQKVYVTQSDISDAQDLNRTAVTQNGF